MKVLEADGIPPDVARLLFDAWVQYLAAQRFGLSQWGSSGDGESRTKTFGSAEGPHFEVRGAGRHVALGAVVGLTESDVLDVVDLAIARVAAHDFGQAVVYRTTMTIEAYDFAAVSPHFMRILGDQVHIEGSRRLSDVVLLDFEEGLLADAPPGGVLLAPTSRIEVTLFGPGPCASELSGRWVAGMVELVAAICALATGRSVQFSIPRFPAEDPDVDVALERRSDWTILGLARESVSLDIFGALSALGGSQAAERVKGCVLAYHSALQQASPDVAVMLFVSAIEALISPWPDWGRSQVTPRFVKAVIDLCPNAVDDLVAHANVEQAFGWRRRGSAHRQRSDLLRHIYNARSVPTHRGPALADSGPLGLASPGQMQVALVSDLARAALLAFLQAPRSSLVGHPACMSAT